MDGFLVLLFCWNVFVFLLYGLDKAKAEKHKWRISEKTLILAAFFMGAFGAFFGMRIFRHKTKKPMFRAFVFIAILVNSGIVYLVERI